MKENPTTLSQRIETVGTSVFGAGRGWTTALARGLKMSRSQLFEYRRGARTERDVDGMLLDLINRERDAAAARVSALTALRNQMLSLMARARKQERRDAA